MKKLFLSLILTLTLLSPGMVFAQATNTAPPKLDYSGFVKCDGVVDAKIKPGEEERQTECHFAQLIDTIIKLINWMFYISIPVAATLFAYGGILYMTGTSGNIGTAKKIFTSAGVGFIIMITAWLVVTRVVTWFVEDTSGATTFIGTKNQ